MQTVFLLPEAPPKAKQEAISEAKSVKERAAKAPPKAKAAKKPAQKSED